MKAALLDYVLMLADNAFIHGHRLSEWCGHAPELEVDLALTNLSLDDLGAARQLYQYAVELENLGHDEDWFPYQRDTRAFRNVLLVELPKGNFAETMARCLYFDTYQFLFYTALKQGSDSRLAAIAEKSLKEVTYHLRFSREWVIRLGDGTEESHDKMLQALTRYKSYTGELFQPVEYELTLIEQGCIPDPRTLKTAWINLVRDVLDEATINIPFEQEEKWFQQGGKTGLHTEHLGYILADIQYLQKTYPGAEW